MSESATRLLVFEVGKQLLAIEARDAVEVLDPIEPTPIPGAIDCVAGLINLRGTLTVITELSDLLGVAASEVDIEPALIVAERGERRLALAVERVLGVAPPGAASLDIDVELLEALGARDLVCGVGEFEGRAYAQLNLDAVFERVLDQPGDRGRSARTAAIGGQEGG